MVLLILELVVVTLVLAGVYIALTEGASVTVRRRVQAVRFPALVALSIVCSWTLGRLEALTEGKTVAGNAIQVFDFKTDQWITCPSPTSTLEAASPSIRTGAHLHCTALSMGVNLDGGEHREIIQTESPYSTKTYWYYWYTAYVLELVLAATVLLQAGLFAAYKPTSSNRVESAYIK